MRTIFRKVPNEASDRKKPIQRNLEYEDKECVMKKLAILLLLVSLVGCTFSRGYWYEYTGTNVRLSTDNYKIIKAGAKGESQGFWLFWFIPIFSPTVAEAKEKLYQSANEKMEGKPIALANQTEDRPFTFYLLFSIPKIIITADVIEFKEGSVGETGPKQKNKPLSMDQRFKGIKGIVLENGTVIEGEILSLNADIIRIRTRDGKVLSYDFKEEVQTFITE
jgi:hypothetical protein